MKARLLLRHLFRFVGDQGAYSVRTGAWWIPVATVILGIVVVAAATFQVVVPHAVYVFF